MTAAPARPERVTRTANGQWICVPDCGNTDPHGFFPCDQDGRPVAPVPVAWDGTSTVCLGCGRIFDQRTGHVTGHRPFNLATESSTCEHCGAYIERRGVWQHVTADEVTLQCAGTHRRAQPVDTGNPASLLGAIMVNLTVYGASNITLYADGFEVGGPEDASVLWVGGEWTPDFVAGALRVPVDAITDLRQRHALN